MNSLLVVAMNLIYSQIFPVRPETFGTTLVYHLFLVSLNSLPLNLTVTLTLHIQLIILTSARWSANSLSFFTGQVSLLYNILCSQFLYNLPLIRRQTSLLVNTGTHCPHLFHLVHIQPPQLHQHLHLCSACHPSNRTYPLTLDLYHQQYPHWSYTY